MNQENYRLFNFKINPKVKNQFHHLCRSKRSKITSELNRAINKFISVNKSPSIYQNHLEWFMGKGIRKT